MNMHCNTPVTPAPPVPDAADNLISLMQSMKERKHHIIAALEYAEGTHTFDDIVHMVVSQRLLWWPLPNGFMATEIVTYPRTKHFNMFLGGGDLEEIVAMQDTVVRAAKSLGCTALTVSGRRGWVKALEKHGWKESHTSVILHFDTEPTNSGD